MLTAAILRALESYESPRARPVVKPREAAPEPASFKRELEARPSLEKFRQEDLEAAGIQRPLLPEDFWPKAENSGNSYDNFRRALEIIEGQRKHKLDVFE